MQADQKPVIAVLGGTGKEGNGLALRWAHRGYSVVLGSRTADRAQEAAVVMNATLGISGVRGMNNADAAAAATVVVLAVPFSAQQSTVSELGQFLEGKILIDVTVPLVPPRVGVAQLPEGRSAVQAVQERLGDGVRVVSAFQNISAHHLTQLDAEIECDVLVCADDPEAADFVVGLAQDIGLRAWNAGALANSAVAEGLTSVLITLNRRYKVPGAGIRITGLEARI
jgi:NADPH-dependent F420 reductase